MSRVKWERIWTQYSDEMYMAVHGGCTLGVQYEGDNGYLWDVWYYERMAEGYCKTARGAKSAATRYANGRR